MSVLRFKAGDTYPPLTAALNDETGWLDLSTASAIDLTAVGQVDEDPQMITGAVTPIDESTITATLAEGSAVLTAVSSFADIKVGTTLVGEGIPVAAQVGSFDEAAQTINMVVIVIQIVDGVPTPSATPALSTASASGETVTIGRGQVVYPWEAGDTDTADTYKSEYLITWSAGQYQRVPNAAAANPQFFIDPALSSDPS